MTKPHLNDIPTKVEILDKTYRVIYEIKDFSGYCDYALYETKGVNKPIKQSIWLLVNTDMGDIIEYLHKKSPLSSEDFDDINMSIRKHSLETLKSQMGNLSK